MAVSQYYDLNMTPGNVPLHIHVSQYDVNSRILVFHLYNGDDEYSVPSGATVTARFTKASGNASIESCSYTGNVVSLVVSDQLTLYPGNVEVELRITQGTAIINSANFVVNVEIATVDADATISDDDIPLVEQLTEDVASLTTSVGTLQDEVEGEATTATASGATVTIENGVKSPIINLTTSITGSQNLNGYDKPWAGGGGKNLLKLSGRTAVMNASNSNTSVRDCSADYAYIGITMNNWYQNSYVSSYTLAENSITVTATTSGYGVGLNVAVESETTYTFSYENEVAGVVGFGFYDTDGAYLSYKQTNNLTDFTFTTPANCVNVMIVFRPSPNVATTYANPQLELGSSATAYEPYENICPITAYDSVNVTRCGKNLFGDSVINGYVRLGFVKTGETYTATATRSDTTIATYCYVRRSNDGLTTAETVGQIIAGSQSSAITFSAESGYDYYVWCNSSYSNVATVQIEKGSTATAFSEYDGKRYTVSFGDNAGTVYNGTLDVTNGLLTVTSKMIQIGSVSWYSYSDYFRTDAISECVTGVNGTVSDAICSVYPTTAPNNIVDKSLNITTAKRLAIKDSSFADVDAMLSAIGDQQIMYPLETPATYRVNPTEIVLMDGENNLSADTGNIAVSYYETYPALIAVNALIDNVATLKNDGWTYLPVYDVKESAVTSIVFSIPVTATEIEFNYFIKRTTTTSTYVWMTSGGQSNHECLARAGTVNSQYAFGSSHIWIGRGMVSSLSVYGNSSSLSNLAGVSSVSFVNMNGYQKFIDNNGVVKFELSNGMEIGTTVSVRYR